MVAAQAHQKGSRTSASNPTSVKTIQNIFFCMEVYECKRCSSLSSEPYSLNSDRKESSSTWLSGASQ
jgi:hypothetical protein